MHWEDGVSPVQLYDAEDLIVPPFLFYEKFADATPFLSHNFLQRFYHCWAAHVG